MRLNLPSWATICLGLIAGLLTALLHAGVIHPGHNLSDLITYGLVFIGLLGVGPLLGNAFRAALHLPTWVTIVIGAILGVLVVLSQSAALGQTARTIIITVITVAAYLGFAPTATPTI